MSATNSNCIHAFDVSIGRTFIFGGSIPLSVWCHHGAGTVWPGPSLLTQAWTVSGFHTGTGRSETMKYSCAIRIASLYLVEQALWRCSHCDAVPYHHQLMMVWTGPGGSVSRGANIPGTILSRNRKRWRFWAVSCFLANSHTQRNDCEIILYKAACGLFFFAWI